MALPAREDRGRTAGKNPIARHRWLARTYDGATSVVHRHLGAGPWLYVTGPDPDWGDSDRRRMCEQLAAYLNHESPRPAWLDDMERTSGVCLEGCDFSQVLAVGPLDTRGRERTDHESRNARHLLILLLAGRQEGVHGQNQT